MFGKSIVSLALEQGRLLLTPIYIIFWDLNHKIKLGLSEIHLVFSTLSQLKVFQLHISATRWSTSTPTTDDVAAQGNLALVLMQRTFSPSNAAKNTRNSSQKRFPLWPKNTFRNFLEHNCNLVIYLRQPATRFFWTFRTVFFSFLW